MQSVLSHLLLPQESNNHRAKLLHHNSLLIITVLFLTLQLVLSSIHAKHPEVLGTSTNISAQELLNLTNQQRSRNNLPPLSLNDQLSSAAENKSQDMFKSNYWAHFSPIGITPWSFIKAAGYDYTYAGENLARGFTTSADIINAWMNSPSHRDNVLSPNYKDVGFAIDDGNLLGEHTTLVVEEFGSRITTTTQVASSGDAEPTLVPKVAAQLVPSPTILPTPTTRVIPSPDFYRKTPQSHYEQFSVGQQVSVLSAFTHNSLISSLFLSKSITTLLLTLFLFVFLADALLIERRKIVRYIGNHVDHAFFFALIFVFIIFFGTGAIL